MESFKFATIAQNKQQISLENLLKKERIFAEKLINQQINAQICCKLDENVLMDCIKLIKKYNLNLNRFDLCRIIEEKKMAKLLKSGKEKKIGTNLHLMTMNTPSATIWDKMENSKHDKMNVGNEIEGEKVEENVKYFLKNKIKINLFSD